jgi:hypothetical protein
MPGRSLHPQLQRPQVGLRSILPFALVLGPIAGLLTLAPLLAPLDSAAATSPPTAPASASTPLQVSFRNDVMAVLSKAGCNAGPCHGNQNGKASFKLSLRGEDSAWDHRALTRDMLARRIDVIDPDESLILLKATTQLAHEGGRRFTKDSDEYAILRAWIAAGAPNDQGQAPALARLVVTPAERILIEPTNSLQLTARAFFADGTERDVTRRAVYETSTTQASVSSDGLVALDQPGETTVLVRFLDRQEPVRLALAAARPGFAWKPVPENNRIDREVFAKLRALRMTPSELCSDQEFVRRAYLDLSGLLPSAGEARAFCDARRADKRERLVNELLGRPEFAEFWALKWSDILRNEEKVLDRRGVQLYSDWIRQSLAENKPLHQFAREIIAARGSTYANPPANFYRATRDPTTRAEATAQLFLGTRLQCARCHNHPFDRWTQADYYDWADVFARIKYKVLENSRRDGLDSHEFIGEQIVYLARDGGMTNARTGLPAHARFLGEKEKTTTTAKLRSKPAALPPATAAGGPAAEGAGEATELDRLAEWLTAQPNFARAQVNWVWFQLMGRGIVDPIDDFRPTNPPSHPALLDTLAREFVAHQYDLRWLIRLITASRTYQLSARPNETNAGDEINYAHAAPRRLTAEQLLDTQHQVLDVPAQFRGFPDGLRAAQLPGGSPVRRQETRMGGAEKFLAVFGKPARLLACECERSSETTLGQTFQLISSPEMDELLTHPQNRLSRLLEKNLTAAAIVDELYWTALSRPPSSTELERTTRLLNDAPSPAEKRRALEDITWALLNAKEFVLRR